MAEKDIVERLRERPDIDFSNPLDATKVLGLLADRVEAAALIARLRARAPDGWRLVPVEPTDEMLDAATRELPSPWKSMAGLYRAMLAASPEPPSEPPFEFVPPYKLAEAFGVSIKQAQKAIGHLGYLHRQLAAP